MVPKSVDAAASSPVSREGEQELHKNPARVIAHDYDCLVERARLLAAGAVILLHVLSRYGMEAARVKVNGMRGGLVVSYARHADNWRQALPFPPAAH